MNFSDDDVRFYPLGDTAIVLQFGQKISDEIYDDIRMVSNYLDEYSFEGFVEYVPAFTTITIFYEPAEIDYTTVRSHLLEMLSEIRTHSILPQSRVVEIPVWYGGEWGPDLDFVAAHANLRAEQVVRLHCEPLYKVHLIGFAPGFPYLAGMDAQLAAPRKETPRAKIAAGAVGIAGTQTGVYPIETPGGWQIIGRTPLDLFDIGRAAPALLKAGDTVRFRAISEIEYEMIRRSVHGA